VGGARKPDRQFLGHGGRQVVQVGFQTDAAEFREHKQGELRWRGAAAGADTEAGKSHTVSHIGHRDQDEVVPSRAGIVGGKRLAEPPRMGSNQGFRAGVEILRKAQSFNADPVFAKRVAIS
jgi:hypothetical protein